MKNGYLSLLSCVGVNIKEFSQLLLGECLLGVNIVIMLVQGHTYQIQGKPKHSRSYQRKELLKESVE